MASFVKKHPVEAVLYIGYGQFKDCGQIYTCLTDGKGMVKLNDTVIKSPISTPQWVKDAIARNDLDYKYDERDGSLRFTTYPWSPGNFRRLDPGDVLINDPILGLLSLPEDDFNESYM